MRNFRNDYNADGKEQRRAARERAGNKCIRCGSPSVPGKILTTHHFDGDKANDQWWNLLALCQVCHLHIQGKVDPNVPFFLEHTPWIKPYVGGFMARKYLGLDLEKYKVIQFLDELTEIEQRSCQKDFSKYLSSLRESILCSELPHQKRAGKILLQEMQDGCEAQHRESEISGPGICQNQPQSEIEAGTPRHNGGPPWEGVEAQ